jgi:hypothetical protein
MSEEAAKVVLSDYQGEEAPRSLFKQEQGASYEAVKKDW